MSKPAIYTIGHSTHPIDFFLELLYAFQVNYIADVRSLAASRFNPQYNKKALARSLEQNGIQYHHFGEEFGARQTDPRMLSEEGRVNFQKMRNSEGFKKGIEQLKRETAGGYTIALMCSESEPLDCHRFSMISPALEDFEVRHILKDKSAASKLQMEEQLLTRYAKKLSQPDLFEPIEDQLELAYQLLNKEAAYSPAAHRRVFKK